MSEASLLLLLLLLLFIPPPLCSHFSVLHNHPLATDAL